MVLEDFTFLLGNEARWWRWEMLLRESVWAQLLPAVYPSALPPCPMCCSEGAGAYVPLWAVDMIWMNLAHSCFNLSAVGLCDVAHSCRESSIPQEVTRSKWQCDGCFFRAKIWLHSSTVFDFQNPQIWKQYFKYCWKLYTLIFYFILFFSPRSVMQV